MAIQEGEAGRGVLSLISCIAGKCSLIARASPPAAGVWRIVRFKLRVERRWYKLHLLYDENGRVVTFAIAGVTMSLGIREDA